MSPTFASIFSGGCLADEGAKAAGYDLLWGIEYDSKIAAVAQANGHNVTVADVLDCDPHNFTAPDLFHASPVCTNASVANANGKESDNDIACGEKTGEFIRVLLPKFVTIENVAGYRHFEAFRRITKALDDCGYFYDVSILRAEDFGVPQSRHRLFVRAVLGGLIPALPAPTPKMGWYQAVKDLIPTFPTTEFAPWQLSRLPEEIGGSIITRPAQYNPAKERGKGYYKDDEPTPTAMTCNAVQRAFISDSLNYSSQNPNRFEDEPVLTVICHTNQHPAPRAFVVSGGQGDIAVGCAVVNGTTDDNGKRVTVRGGNEPIFTMTSSESKRPARAWLSSGRVVKITPRGLARFQTLRDDYILPENAMLACKIIGNAIPCLMYQRIAKSFVK